MPHLHCIIKDKLASCPELKFYVMGFPRYPECRVFPKKGYRYLFAIIAFITLIWAYVSDYRPQLQLIEERQYSAEAYQGIYISMISIILIVAIMYWVTVRQIKYLYDLDAVYSKLDPEVPNKALDAMAEMICRDTLLDMKGSIYKKCRRLVNINKFTIKIQPQEHNYIHVMSIYMAFCALEEMLDQSPLVKEQREEFMNRFTKHALKDLTPYYGSVLSLAGMVARNGKPCDVSSKLLSRFNLPVIRS